ncbi:hypothetical protein B7494_g6094 [Chlorociboria aeruginascens]|nr:hypothetical protein B7494_g6094 [Chlorociboria aeruginascens]
MDQRRYRDPERLDGLPALANFIGEDSEAEIFRRFSRLGARNLLYLQSIVGDLERQLNVFDKYDAENAAGNLALRQTARTYSYFRTIASTGRGHVQDGISKQHARERIALHEQITIAIKEYREALIQEQQLLSFKNPAPRPLSTFQRYFFGGETDETVLEGPDEHILDDPRDLVALASLDNDRLSGFLRNNFGWCFRSFEGSTWDVLGGKSNHTRLHIFEDNTIKS